MRFPGWRYLGGAVLCALGALPFFAAPCLAGFAGSRHDWKAGPQAVSTPADLVPAGSCSACHVPHRGDAILRIWSRSLTEERALGKYDQTSSPDYLPGETLLCYDCHDDASWADSSPDPLVWQSTYGPQDIALSGHGNGSGPNSVGYYELINGAVPGPLPNVPPADGSPTGGHYWKADPSDAKGPGDKIACSFCHDVHNHDTGTNMVFFRKTSVDGSAQDLGNGHKSSKNTRSGKDLVGESGRSMCVACHGYSNGGTPKTFLGVNLADVGRRPPLSVAPHSILDTTTACTNCHAHNRIRASCTDCHGYPPTSGAHQRHRDALGAGIFDCAICHGPDPGSAVWHNNGSGTVAVDQVDVMGQTSWWGSSSPTYVGVDSDVTPVPDGYAFVKKGGGDAETGKICANLACHGYPTGDTTGDAGRLNWYDDMTDDATGDAGPDREICSWCHDATPAVLDKDGAGTAYGPVKAPNIMGGGSGTGAWGAVVNGHGHVNGSYEGNAVGEVPQTGRPAANKGCSVCHDATYTAGTGPDKTHFDGSYASGEKRLRDLINGEPLANLVPAPNGTLSDAACIACHQRTTGNDDGLQVSSHGNAFSDLQEDQFRRECRSCHEPHGRNWNGATRNLHMVGRWLDNPIEGPGSTWGATDAGEEARVDSNATGVSPAVSITTDDAKVIFTASTGEDSYDDGFNDGLATPESVCVVCHADLVSNHNEVTDVTTLRDFGHNPVGSDCMSCHNHDKDNAVATADAFAPSGCTACHGTNATEALQPGAIRGQFWPDGAAVSPTYTYADNQPGAHLNHVAVVAAQVFGETPAQLVVDTTIVSATKQVVVCAFCHAGPGQPGHHVNSSATPSGTDRVEVFQGASAGNYFSKFTTGTHVNATSYGRAYFAEDIPGGAYNYVVDSCSALVCHNQAATPAAPATGQTPGWNTPPAWNATATCSATTCHAEATYTNAHATHAGAAGRNYGCGECHVNNGAPAPPVTALGHQNGSVEMVFTNAGALEAGFGGGNGFYDKSDVDPNNGVHDAGDDKFAYKDTAAGFGKDCLNIYCHGDDNAAGKLPAADRGSDTTPIWNNAATADCGTCHGATAASPVGSSSHPKHAGSAAGQYAIGCQVCHYGTTTDGTTIASQALHVNTSVEVSFGADARVEAATSLYGGDAILGSGFGACTNTYCHSQGTDRVAPYDDAAAAPKASPALAWNATGGCGSCHGDGTAAGAPSYPDATLIGGVAKANKHEKHVTDNGYGCRVCHWPTTHDNGTAIFAPGNHVNGSYEADDDGVDPTLDQFTYTAGAPATCSANCHGDDVAVAGAVGWNAVGPIACEVCHARVGAAAAASDVNSFHWDGSIQSKISDVATTGEYEVSGHGKTGVAIACSGAGGCHSSDADVNHDRTMAGTNPYRLNAAFTCSDTSACHTGATTSTVQTHSNEVMGSAAKRTWPATWDPQCVNCHDPHGDGNLAMIQREIYDKAAFHLNGSAPAVPTEQTSLVFTDDTTGAHANGSTFADLDADFSSICQECHEDDSMVSFQDGEAGTGTGGSGAAGAHPSPGESAGKCTSCHAHATGFAPSTCESCHDSTPDPGLSPSAYDDAPNVMSFYNVNGHGTKTFDPTGPETVRAVGCKDCHEISSPSPNTHLTGTVETYEYPTSPYGGPNGNTSHLNSSYFASASTAKDYQLNFDMNCNKNAVCHRNPPAVGHTPMISHEQTHKDGVVRFGAHSTTTNPKQDRGDEATYWTPWTIRDITILASDTPLKYYAPCIACHDPHGVDTSGYTYCLSAPDGNYHMVKKNFCNPTFFCNSNCHIDD